MKSSYKAARFVSTIKFECINYFRENKLKFFICCFVLIIGLLTGILTAIKFARVGTLNAFNDYGLYNFSKGNLGTLPLFFSRCGSLILLTLILSILSLSPFSFPVGVVVLLYRAYLIGLNVCLMICLFGVSGILTAILIILPFQLAILSLLLAYSVLFCKFSKMNKTYGKCYNGQRWKLSIIFLVIMILICILETVLLLLFSSDVILVL